MRASCVRHTSLCCCNFCVVWDPRPSSVFLHCLVLLVRADSTTLCVCPGRLVAARAPVQASSAPPRSCPTQPPCVRIVIPTQPACMLLHLSCLILSLVLVIAGPCPSCFGTSLESKTSAPRPFDLRSTGAAAHGCFVHSCSCRYLQCCAYVHQLRRGVEHFTAWCRRVDTTCMIGACEFHVCTVLLMLA